MIDSQIETILPFGVAARRLPSLRAGRPVSPATLWRWAAIGCLSRSGQRIRLETIRIGGSTCTSIEALQRFFTRLSGEEAVATAAPAGKRHARAEAALDAAGI